VFAGSRSDAFYFDFDFDGIKNLFDTSGNRNFTAPLNPLAPSRDDRRQYVIGSASMRC
jgi:hypothetical protein